MPRLLFRNKTQQILKDCVASQGLKEIANGWMGHG